MKRPPATAASGAKVARSVLRRRSTRRTRPATAAPGRPSTARPAEHAPGSRSRHSRTSAGRPRDTARSHGIVSHVVEKARGSPLNEQWKSNRGTGASPSGTSATPGPCAERGQRRGHHGETRAPACQHRQIAQELQRIAEALLLRTSHRAPVRSGRRDSGGSRRPAGKRCARLCQDPVLILPRLGKSSGLQTRHGAVHPDLPIAGRARQRLVVRLQRRVELSVRLEHHAEIRPERRWRRAMGDRLAKLPRRLGEAPGLGQCHPVWSCASALLGCAARSGSSNATAASPSPCSRRNSGQAIAQPRIVRRQRQTRAILWLDEWRLVLFRQHARQIGARMSVQAARPRDAVQDQGAAASASPRRADREAEEQQRLNIPAISVEQFGGRCARPGLYRPLSSSVSASCNRDSRCAASKSAPPPP